MRSVQNIQGILRKKRFTTNTEKFQVQAKAGSLRHEQYCEPAARAIRQRAAARRPVLRSSKHQPDLVSPPPSPRPHCPVHFHPQIPVLPQRTLTPAAQAGGEALRAAVPHHAQKLLCAPQRPARRLRQPGHHEPEVSVHPLDPVPLSRAAVRPASPGPTRPAPATGPCRATSPPAVARREARRAHGLVRTGAGGDASRPRGVRPSTRPRPRRPRRSLAGYHPPSRKAGGRTRLRP